MVDGCVRQVWLYGIVWYNCFCWCCYILVLAELGHICFPQAICTRLCGREYMLVGGHMYDGYGCWGKCYAAAYVAYIRH